MAKTHTTITLDVDVWMASVGNGLNISKVCNDALAVENSMTLEMKKDNTIPKELILNNTVIHLKDQLVEAQKIIKDLNEKLEMGKQKYQKRFHKPLKFNKIAKVKFHKPSKV